MTEKEIKILIENLDLAFKRCQETRWQDTYSSFYAGMKRLVESLGFEIVTDKGKHKLLKEGEKIDC